MPPLVSNLRVDWGGTSLDWEGSSEIRMQIIPAFLNSCMPTRRGSPETLEGVSSLIGGGDFSLIRWDFRKTGSLQNDWEWSPEFA